MRRILFWKFVPILAVMVVSAWWFAFGKPVSKQTQLPVDGRGSDACAFKIDLKVALKTLGSADWAQAAQTRKALLRYSKESPACRKEIIDTLLQAMNKPQLNFVSDQRSYFLWSNGSSILGELQAVEALDLLIDHLDLNDGEFSASMAHQPAILGVKAMGVIAVPKLSAALQHSTNRNIRLAAALCLADIGGPEANNALKQVLGSEKDQCVRRFISLSIASPASRNKSKGEPSESAPDADVLSQRLLAFRCDN